MPSEADTKPGFASEEDKSNLRSTNSNNVNISNRLRNIKEKIEGCEDMKYLLNDIEDVTETVANTEKCVNDACNSLNSGFNVIVKLSEKLRSISNESTKRLRDKLKNNSDSDDASWFNKDFLLDATSLSSATIRQQYLVIRLLRQRQQACIDKLRDLSRSICGGDIHARDSESPSNRENRTLETAKNDVLSNIKISTRVKDIVAKYEQHNVGEKSQPGIKNTSANKVNKNTVSFAEHDSQTPSSSSSTTNISSPFLLTKGPIWNEQFSDYITNRFDDTNDESEARSDKGNDESEIKLDKDNNPEYPETSSKGYLSGEDEIYSYPKVQPLTVDPDFNMNSNNGNKEESLSPPDTTTSTISSSKMNTNRSHTENESSEGCSTSRNSNHVDKPNYKDTYSDSLENHSSSVSQFNASKTSSKTWEIKQEDIGVNNGSRNMNSHSPETDGYYSVSPNIKDIQNSDSYHNEDLRTSSIHREHIQSGDTISPGSAKYNYNNLEFEKGSCSISSSNNSIEPKSSISTSEGHTDSSNTTSSPATGSPDKDSRDSSFHSDISRDKGDEHQSPGAQRECSGSLSSTHDDKEPQNSSVIFSDFNSAENFDDGSTHSNSKLVQEPIFEKQIAQRKSNANQIIPRDSSLNQNILREEEEYTKGNNPIPDSEKISETREEFDQMSKPVNHVGVIIPDKSTSEKDSTAEEDDNLNSKNEKNTNRSSSKTSRKLSSPSQTQSNTRMSNNESEALFSDRINHNENKSPDTASVSSDGINLQKKQQILKDLMNTDILKEHPELLSIPNQEMLNPLNSKDIIDLFNIYRTQISATIAHQNELSKNLEILKARLAGLEKKNTKYTSENDISDINEGDYNECSSLERRNSKITKYESDDDLPLLRDPDPSMFLTSNTSSKTAFLKRNLNLSRRESLGPWNEFGRGMSKRMTEGDLNLRQKLSRSHKYKSCGVVQGGQYTGSISDLPISRNDLYHSLLDKEHAESTSIENLFKSCTQDFPASSKYEYEKFRKIIEALSEQYNSYNKNVEDLQELVKEQDKKIKFLQEKDPVKYNTVLHQEFLESHVNNLLLQVVNLEYDLLQSEAELQEKNGALNELENRLLRCGIQSSYADKESIRNSQGDTVMTHESEFNALTNISERSSFLTMKINDEEAEDYMNMIDYAKDPKRYEVETSSNCAVSLFKSLNLRSENSKNSENSIAKKKRQTKTVDSSLRKQSLYWKKYTQAQYVKFTTNGGCVSSYFDVLPSMMRRKLSYNTERNAVSMIEGKNHPRNTSQNGVWANREYQDSNHPSSISSDTDNKPLFIS